MAIAPTQIHWSRTGGGGVSQTTLWISGMTERFFVMLECTPINPAAHKSSTWRHCARLIQSLLIIYYKFTGTACTDKMTEFSFFCSSSANNISSTFSSKAQLLLLLKIHWSRTGWRVSQTTLWILGMIKRCLWCQSAHQWIQLPIKSSTWRHCVRLVKSLLTIYY